MAEETLEVINAIIADDPDFFLESDVEKPVKKSRTREHSIDYDSTTWMRMLRDPRIIDENSSQAKRFRLRFRTPFLMFRDFLIPMVRSADIFPPEDDGRVNVPLETKVLAPPPLLRFTTCPVLPCPALPFPAMQCHALPCPALCSCHNNICCHYIPHR